MCWHGELQMHTPRLRCGHWRSVGGGAGWSCSTCSRSYTARLRCLQTADTKPVVLAARGSLQTCALLISMQAPQCLPDGAC